MEPLVHGTPRPITTEHEGDWYENKNAHDNDSAYGEDDHVNDIPANLKKFGDKETTVLDYLKLLDKNFADTLDRINRIKNSNFNQEDGDKYAEGMFLDNVNDYNIEAPNILPEKTLEHLTGK